MCECAYGGVYCEINGDRQGFKGKKAEELQPAIPVLSFAVITCLFCRFNVMNILLLHK